MERLEQLPEHLLDKIVKTALTIDQSLRSAFISSFGSRIHNSAVRVLFLSLNVEDCEDRFYKSSVYPIILNPARYGHIVKSLTIINPTFGEGFSDDAQGLRALRPISADILTSLLQSCTSLETFRWESSLPPPDGICEQLSSFSTRLTSFHYNPYHPTKSTSRWDAPSLPLLKSLPLTALSLKHLSQTGTRALTRLLSNMREDGVLVLEDLDLDLLWLDEPVCLAIAEAGTKIGRLCLRTNGTKLNDKGLTSIIEKCENLENLVLDQVQGRISRCFWTKPLRFSSGLRSLRISISETGHSWANDHLDSLPSFPLEQLTELSISSSSSADGAVSIKPLPAPLSERLRDCKSLTKFHCDHWAIPLADLKSLLESCSRLECLKICLEASFSKLLGLTSTSLSNLHTLSVSLHPDRAPGTPPPALSPNALAHLPLPASSEVPAAKEKTTDDPSLPLLRDVKRFARKCPKLGLLDWYGKNARGSWIVQRPFNSSKNVSVEHLPPRLSSETWKDMLREDQIRIFLDRGGAWLNETRSGQQWTGDQAEIHLISDVAEQGKDAGVEKNPRRAGSKKPRVPSISTSSSISDLPSTPIRASVSPVDVYSLTASPLEAPLSMSRHLDFSSNSAFTSAQTRDHRRSPSEPDCYAEARWKTAKWI
ncbi:hypothetical protein BT96DRAFT_598528 [Gymnopus androsaceus JB14]|uniref:Uncharacterized protein n=1 Tax=Gymnopus androsaceus JB14 TaxID=1447944 RepID=A0A6A4HTV1_9AGAR|nr:hypothetical protein BT96DRAFT_598528 [Gymnopus androsaceus JB14]